MWKRPDRRRQGALGFLLLLGWFALQNGWRPLCLLLACAAVHEGGHLLALYACGGRVSGVRLSPLGAELRTAGLRLAYPAELAAVLAGPAANLLCAAVLAGFPAAAPLCPLAGASWVLGIFNLLPLRPLDGGRALELLTLWILGPAAGERITAAVGAVTGCALCAALVWLMGKSGGNVWLAPAAAGALWSALRELGLGGRMFKKRGKRAAFC